MEPIDDMTIADDSLDGRFNSVIDTVACELSARTSGINTTLITHPLQWSAIAVLPP